MVYFIAHGIPYLRSQLPLINQMWSVTRKKPMDIHLCQLQIH